VAFPFCAGTVFSIQLSRMTLQLTRCRFPLK